MRPRHRFSSPPSNVLQRAFHLRLRAFGELVQQIGGFVNRAALFTRGGADLAERLPESQASVGDG